MLLFGLVLAGGATVTWQAMGKAKRLRLVKQAEQHTLNAQPRLGQTATLIGLDTPAD